MRSSSDRERSQLARLLEKNTEISKELERLRSDYNLMDAKVILLCKFSLKIFHFIMYCISILFLVKM